MLDLQRLGRRAAAVDILLYLAVALGIFGLEELFRAMGRFPYPGLFDGAFTLIGSFFFVVWLMRWRGQDWADFGLKRPRRWWSIPLWALAVLATTVLAHLTLVPLLASLFTQEPPDFSRYDVIRGNFGMFVMTALGAMVTGGFIEEFLYRGLMVDRLARIFGGGRRALVLGALLNGVPFGLIHFKWGVAGMVSTAVMGSVLGLMYLATRRNLWPLIAAHATLDFILMLQLYLDLI